MAQHDNSVTILALNINASISLQFNISFIHHAKNFKLNDTFEYGKYLYFDSKCLN